MNKYLVGLGIVFLQSFAVFASDDACTKCMAECPHESRDFKSCDRGCPEFCKGNRETEINQAINVLTEDEEAAVPAMLVEQVATAQNNKQNIKLLSVHQGGAANPYRLYLMIFDQFNDEQGDYGVFKSFSMGQYFSGLPSNLALKYDPKTQTGVIAFDAAYNPAPDFNKQAKVSAKINFKYLERVLSTDLDAELVKKK
jgi:hypothetical protein